LHVREEEVEARVEGNGYFSQFLNRSHIRQQIYNALDIGHRGISDVSLNYTSRVATCRQEKCHGQESHWVRIF